MRFIQAISITHFSIIPAFQYSSDDLKIGKLILLEKNILTL